jgi:hypothetical protein
VGSIENISYLLYENRKPSALKTVASHNSLPYLADMKVIRDCFGQSVRLTDERLAHILEHAEMAGMEDELERVLQTPDEVRRSRSDDQGYFPNRGGFRPDLSLTIERASVLNDLNGAKRLNDWNGLQYCLKAGETVWPKK